MDELNQTMEVIMTKLLKGSEATSIASELNVPAATVRAVEDRHFFRNSHFLKVRQVNVAKRLLGEA
jgi:hypothetical protein